VSEVHSAAATLGQRATASRDVIVMGASAGGPTALGAVLSALPEDLDAIVCVVLHLPAHSPVSLVDILQSRTRLPVVEAHDGAEPERGRVYVAPPDRHLLLEPGRLRVSYGPRENRHRPAIDPLFRSAAWAFGPRVIGVILSGLLDDGVAGLWAIHTCGGATVVQDPAEAAFPDMPANALASMGVDHVERLERLGPLLADLTRGPAPAPADAPRPPELPLETGFALGGGSIDDVDQLGQPSAFTCPSCHGTLWEIRDGSLIRYRCHTGHAFTESSLLEEQHLAMEGALGSSLRAIEEKAELLRRMALRCETRMPRLQADYEARAQELEAHADTLRRLLPRLTP
jgi:two-component system, chemotaxis family, protein-glutamate methylesterase/glutaminase